MLENNELDKYYLLNHVAVVYLHTAAPLHKNHSMKSEGRRNLHIYTHASVILKK